jgi:4,5:9,10-diseco-3-hydroxy-5,9,17-trioxoandrosta-1(10),2-diene-4-oate hydrolase
VTFVERHVEVDGFRIRSLTAGSSDPLVFIHGGGGLHLSKAHDVLAERYRVIALEVPGFGTSSENDRSSSYPELAATLVSAAQKMGAERFKLWGTSFGGAVALWMAIGAPDAVEALVLEAPGAILPEGGIRPSNTREEMRSRLYAHPERQAVAAPPEPDVLQKQRALLDRLTRPTRHETEVQLASLNVPTLVVFGTRDSVISPELGRVYREKMPNCNYVLVFDAGHEVAADRPEAFVSLVGDFLERREAFIVSQTSSLLHP